MYLSQQSNKDDLFLNSLKAVVNHSSVFVMSLVLAISYAFGLLIHLERINAKRNGALLEEFWFEQKFKFFN